MPNLTAADLASRTMRKGWVNRNDTDDEVQDGAEAAAERTRRSVKSHRKPGAITMGLTAVGAAPEIAGTVVKETARKLYDRVYDKRRKREDSED